MTWRRFTLIYAFACLVVFMLFGLYKSIWRFAGFNEFSRTLLTSLLMSAVHIAATLLFYCRMPISYYMIGAVLQCILVLGIRFSYRIILFFSNRSGRQNSDRIMLIGAGAAGQMILRDVNNDPSIIGYGIVSYNSHMDDYSKFTIDIDYRSDRTPTMCIIVASSSELGDYFTGGDG